MTETPAASTGWEEAFEAWLGGTQKILAPLGVTINRRSKSALKDAFRAGYLAAAPARVLSEEDVERAARAFYAAMLKANIAQYGGDGVGLGFDELVAKGEATYSAIMAAMRAALAALSADETIEGK